MNRQFLQYVLVFAVALASALWLGYLDRAGDVVDVHSMENQAPDAPRPGQSPGNDSGRDSDAQAVRSETPAINSDRVLAGNQAAEDEGLGPESPEAPETSLPEGPNRISGRVLSSSGVPLAGVEVAARAMHVFEDGKRKIVSRRASSSVVKTDAYGAYSFQGIANGEYQVSVGETDWHTGATVQIRSGVDFADIVVTEYKPVRVRGVITDRSGVPVQGALVLPQVAGAEEVQTDKSGAYSFEVKTPKTMNGVSVSIRRDGFIDKELQVNSTGAEFDGWNNLDVELTPRDDAKLVMVSGTVRTPDGDSISGYSVRLTTGKLNQDYRTETSLDGSFKLYGVRPGSNYVLSIDVPDDYQEHVQRNITIPDRDLALSVQLQVKNTVTIHGRMVNALGYSVPDYSIEVQAGNASSFSRKLVGDDLGNFAVEGAPSGDLVFRTRSNPYHRVEGLSIHPNVSNHLVLILDWGSDEIRGQVRNEQGVPVSVPNISLTWNYQENGVRSSSRRSTSADQYGNFSFTQLGPGPHVLIVNAEGYHPYRVTHDVATQGSDLVVELVKR